MDLVEVNEAFAPQLSRRRARAGLDRTRPMPVGGAIAIGHPLAATGTRITDPPVALIAAGKEALCARLCLYWRRSGAAVIVEAL